MRGRRRFIALQLSCLQRFRCVRTSLSHGGRRGRVCDDATMKFEGKCSGGSGEQSGAVAGGVNEKRGLKRKADENAAQWFLDTFLACSFFFFSLRRANVVHHTTCCNQNAADCLKDSRFWRVLAKNSQLKNKRKLKKSWEKKHVFVLRIYRTIEARTIVSRMNGELGGCSRGGE